MIETSLPYVVAALSLSIQATEPDGRFVRADDVELHYVEEGSGTPVLLMHGFTSSLEMWHRNGVFRALVDAGYRVVAYDARAHGKSSSFRDPEKYGIEVVEDVRRILDHLNIDKAHVVGYSYGSRVANKFREVHPQRFLSVTIGGFGWPLPPRERDAASYEESLRSRGLLDTMDPVALAAARVRFSELDVEEDNLRKNQIPALVLVGDEDFLYQWAENLADTMSNAEIEVVPGTHITASRSEEFLHVLLDFIDRHNPGASQD